MEEKKLEKGEVMSLEKYQEFIQNKVEEDFKNGVLHLHTFQAVNKYRSVRRAIKRGHVSPYGEIYPKRPFNNRGNSSKRKGHSSRAINDVKKRIYEQIKYK